MRRYRDAPVSARASLASAAGLGTANRERRRYPRRSGRCLVAVLPALAGTGIVSDREWAFRAALLRGTVHDLSIGGVSFTAPEPIEPGCLLDVEMRHPDRPGAVVRRVRVIEQKKQGDDRRKIHCRFLQPLTFAEVSRLSVEPTV